MMTESTFGGRAGATVSDDADGLPRPRRYWSLVAIWIATTAAVLDSSIANIALPTISGDMGASPAACIWVVNAYQIAIAMLLLPLAAAGEIVGYRRVYIAGLSFFALASLFCAVSSTLTELSLARFAQGVGAAGIMSMNGALVRFTYPKAQLGRGIGYNALVVSIASAAGPSIAAAILAVASWRWLFAINVPLILVSLAIGARALPAAEKTARPFDLASALLSAVTFACVFVTGSACARGSVTPWTGVTAALGIIAATALVRSGRRYDTPLIPLDLMMIPSLRMAYITSICSFAAQMIALIVLPFLLESRFGLTHVQTGLYITPMAVGTALAALIAGRLVERITAGILSGVGLMIMAVALTATAALIVLADRTLFIATLTVAGIGFGLFQTPNNRTMLIAAPRSRSGAAAGMLATMRLVGQTSGAVIAASLLRLEGTSRATSLLVAAAMACVAAIMGFLNSPARARFPSDAAD